VSHGNYIIYDTALKLLTQLDLGDGKGREGKGRKRNKKEGNGKGKGGEKVSSYFCAKMSQKWTTEIFWHNISKTSCLWIIFGSDDREGIAYWLCIESLVQVENH